MTRSDVASIVSLTNDSRFSTATSEPASVLLKEQPKQQERIHECLAFLDRIERVKVVNTSLVDGAIVLILDVYMKTNSYNLTEQRTEKEPNKQKKKALRPLVDFRTSKAVTTLKLIHNAIYDWSTKHRARPSANGDAAPCAYCSKFNSPAALELWPKKQHWEVHASETSGLTVVVNNNKLRQYEKCVNHYLQSARTISEGGEDFNALECEGYAHIPSIVASFLQRHQIKTRHMSKFGQTCGSGM